MVTFAAGLAAAHRAGVRRIVLPAQNEPDTEDIPEDVRKELEIVPARFVSEVLDATLEKDVTSPPPRNIPLNGAEAVTDTSAERLIAKDNG